MTSAQAQQWEAIGMGTHMDDAIQELSNSQAQRADCTPAQRISCGAPYHERAMCSATNVCSLKNAGKWSPKSFSTKAAGKRDWTLRLAGESFKATARYVSVAGDPRVLLCVSAPEEEIDLRNRHLLYTDALTGVYNRRFYEDELRHQRIFAGVAVIDLDDFKLVNDSMGHHAGDLALHAAVEAIKRCVRDSDMLVRFGGDEFLLVMPNVDQRNLFAPPSRHMRCRGANTDT